MRKRYQTGGRSGLPADLERLGAEMGVEGFETFSPEESGEILTSSTGARGALDPATAMMVTMQEAFGRTTTPEAQARARGILDRFEQDDRSSWDTILQRKRDQAEAVRQALRTARERLMGQQHKRSELLLAIGRGLGAPTRTGAIGETASNVAGEMQPVVQRRREWDEARDASLSELDLAEAQVNSGVLDAEFELEKLREQIEGRLAVEAMDTLGKSTTSGLSSLLGKVLPESAKALDAEYVKEYIPFISGGSARAARGLATLEFAQRVLESGVDNLTGPYLGAVASIPAIGRWLQAYASPEGADIRDLIEETIQGDLRPTLGTQFTEREGERLIARAYNPSLEEWRNARRIEALRNQLQQAYDSKVSMAQYFNQNGTLFQFPNLKIGYTADDFNFDDGDAEDSPPPNQRVQYRDLPRHEREVQLQVWREANPGQEPPDWMLEGLAEGGPVRYKKGGRVKKFQEGGVAFDAPGERDLEQDLQSLWAEFNDPAGMAVGAGLGLAADSALDTVAQRMVGGRERRVADAISSGGLDPIAVAEDIKRNRRAGVPETLMDTDTAGVQALAEEAFKYGDGAAETALRELRQRVEGSRERVNEQINRGIKPWEYFDYEARISNRLANERRHEMEAAFGKYPTVAPDPVLKRIMETPEGQRAVDWAWRFYENAPGRKPGTVNKAGLLTKPSLEFLDYVRKGFNQTIAREERSGETEFGGVLRDLRKAYLDRLDQVAPEYRGAREAQGDDLDIRDALRDGRRFMRYQPEQLAAMAQSLSFHQKNAFRTGIAQALYETLDRASSQNYNAAQRIVGSPAMLRRLEPFFDTPAQFRVFQTALEREAELSRTGSDLLKMGESARHSREQRRQSPFEYVAQRGPGFRFSISPVGWALRIFRDMPKMSPGEAEKVLDILRRGRPDEMDAFARRVRRLNILRSTRNPRRAAAAAIGAGAGLLFGNDDEE